jgi:putative transposase
MSLEQRRSGWLSAAFHQEFRLLLLHTCARERLVCPVYCLMPDHMHFLLMGVSHASDQRNAMRFLRTYLNAALHALGPFGLQSQAFDHVLHSTERDPARFEAAALYIRENSVRAGLSENWTDWPFAGCMIPGYPDLWPTGEAFWGTFWRIYHKLTSEVPS